MNSRGKRLIFAREYRGYSQEAIANGVGCSQGAITKLENDKVIDSKFLLKICKFLDCDPNWIETGSGISPSDQIVQKGKVPVISWLQVNDFCSNKQKILLNEVKDHLLTENGSVKSFGLKIIGDSMISPYDQRKSFYPGQKILVDPEREPRNGDFVVAVKEGTDEATFKQYIVDANSRFLKPLNPQYPTIPIDETIKICGVIVSKSEDMV